MVARLVLGTRMRETTVFGWANLWNHWDRRGVLRVPVPHEDLEMPFVRCQEEAIYDRRLGDLVQSLETGSLHMHLEVSVNFVVFSWPYDTIFPLRIMSIGYKKLTKSASYVSIVS